MGLSPARTVTELRELEELTGNDNGAQRVAWTETWERARRWLREKVVSAGADEEIDEAGNQWFTLRGSSERALLLGGHIDSVPNGGWLDGCLNVLAAVEVLRRIAEEGTPPLTVRLVEWAPAAARGAGDLGRRGGRPLRPLTVRLLGGRCLDERPGRAAPAARRRRDRPSRPDRRPRRRPPPPRARPAATPQPR